MNTIAFFEIKGWEQKYVQSRLKDFNLKFFEEEIEKVPISKYKDADIISVFIYSNVTAKIINQLSKLKIITTRSTGYDHIDLETAKKKKIVVANVPTYGDNTVAEHTFALILSLSRHVHKSYVRTTKQNFSIEGLTGFDLKGKTIGIIGGGHIGLHVAKIAKGFGMKVLVFDIVKDKFLSEVIGFEYATMEELLKNSDIVSLHAPYNKHTHHLINKETLALMKKGSILINTARGGLVDTDALYEALKSKKLGGAGLDVIEGEENILEEKDIIHHSENLDKMKDIVRNHEIFQMDNVVFTLHNAFNSQEALERILDTTIKNINRNLNSNSYNQVNN
jgi:D-lactate dehydrogenase